ncbi:MliC family protein [Yersinia enterocolitica]|jgi:membrane-bound inhibitor of C-type lysozyme|uniref:Lipoprotein n=1 Tax=Yersinia frederiksenii TaxID=29484 RepID=A0AAI9ELL0_YERFR|nr:MULTISPECIES: MliC family protein [Yersinia]HEC1650298.1 MliC family protein [Yersinia enterocolitica]ATM85779.1 lysozyme inhibitor [Yersinia frederiksenii]MCB5316598.1 MliC family protein [Yersinia massiliensis]MDN0126926.1 MliC family protein [Yersinia massiliensis]CFQ87378.1 putative lipoprotein [Yersinia frederiksenii]
MKYIFAIASATTVLVLAGCSLVQPKNQTLHYQCGTTQLTVMQDNQHEKVSLILDGEQLTLPQVRAASGVKYSDGRYTFWSKGNTAFVERDDKVIINDCVLIKPLS